MNLLLLLRQVYDFPLTILRTRLSLNILSNTQVPVLYLSINNSTAEV